MARKRAKSTWYTRAAEVIAGVLATMPATATRKECLEAVRAAYPFGLREHHPYKMWCRAQKDALAARFPVKAFEDERCKARVTWHIHSGRLAHGPVVWCPVCKEHPVGSFACILCLDLRRRWASLWAGRSAKDAFRDAFGDAASMAMLVDFLMDEFPEVAAKLLQGGEE